MAGGRKSGNSADAVDAYIAACPEPHRTTLSLVRERIRAAAPDATEAIHYQMPAFHQDGGLVCYAAFKAHCSLFPMSYLPRRQLAAELGRYGGKKGTIQFPVDKPLSATLIRKIVKLRIAENAGKQAARGAKARSKTTARRKTGATKG